MDILNVDGLLLLFLLNFQHIPNQRIIEHQASLIVAASQVQHSTASTCREHHRVPLTLPIWAEIEYNIFCTISFANREKALLTFGACGKKSVTWSERGAGTRNRTQKLLLNCSKRCVWPLAECARTISNCCISGDLIEHARRLVSKILTQIWSTHIHVLVESQFLISCVSAVNETTTLVTKIVRKCTYTYT